MEQKNPRSINLSGARGGIPQTPQRQGQRPMFDQSVGAGQPAQGYGQSAQGQPQQTTRAGAQPRGPAQSQQGYPQQRPNPAAYSNQPVGQQRPNPAAYSNQPVGQQRGAYPQQPQGAQRPQGANAYGQATRPAQGGAPQQPYTQAQQQELSRRRAAAGRQQAPSQSDAQQTIASGNGGKVRVRKKKKKSVLNRAIAVFSTIFAVLLVGYIGFQVWGNSFVNEGAMGGLQNTIATPPQLRGDQLNLLMIGIDYSTEDAVVRDPIGMTDMIMYVRFDFKESTMKMLQIPRDLFVGDEIASGGTGKLNAVFKYSADEKNRVNTLSQYVYDKFQLPVDAYATIDMDSLREIVDLFGGIDVYVPRDMEYAGSRLLQGQRHLMGAETEFFLRNRHGAGFATGDIARLDMQRYFYSALFRTVRTATWQDIVKLMPVVNKYINTSLSLNDCMALVIKMLKIPSANIMMCRMSTFDSTKNYNKSYAVQIANKEGIAQLLNENFRPADDPITAAEIQTPNWEHAETPHLSNVQWMSDVDEQGGGTAGEAADASQTGDDLLGSSSAPQSETTPAA